ncbi:MAG: hypothetical protein JJP05_07795 [cyanobacterium endosymbiont of Rhopalodia gibba]
MARAIVFNCIKVNVIDKKRKSFSEKVPILLNLFEGAVRTFTRKQVEINWLIWH